MRSSTCDPNATWEFNWWEPSYCASGGGFNAYYEYVSPMDASHTRPCKGSCFQCDVKTVASWDAGKAATCSSTDLDAAPTVFSVNKVGNNSEGTALELLDDLSASISLRETAVCSTCTGADESGYALNALNKCTSNLWGDSNTTYYQWFESRQPECGTCQQSSGDENTFDCVANDAAVDSCFYDMRPADATSPGYVSGTRIPKNYGGRLQYDAFLNLDPSSTLPDFQQEPRGACMPVYRSGVIDLSHNSALSHAGIPLACGPNDPCPEDQERQLQCYYPYPALTCTANATCEAAANTCACPAPVLTSSAPFNFPDTYKTTDAPYVCSVNDGDPGLCTSKENQKQSYGTCAVDSGSMESFECPPMKDPSGLTYAADGGEILKGIPSANNVFDTFTPFCHECSVDSDCGWLASKSGEGESGAFCSMQHNLLGPAGFYYGPDLLQKYWSNGNGSDGGGGSTLKSMATTCASETVKNSPLRCDEDSNGDLNAYMWPPIFNLGYCMNVNAESKNMIGKSADTQINTNSWYSIADALQTTKVQNTGAMSCSDLQKATMAQKFSLATYGNRRCFSDGDDGVIELPETSGQTFWICDGLFTDRDDYANITQDCGVITDKEACICQSNDDDCTCRIIESTDSDWPYEPNACEVPVKTPAATADATFTAAAASCYDALDGKTFLNRDTNFFQYLGSCSDPSGASGEASSGIPFCSLEGVEKETGFDPFDAAEVLSTCHGTWKPEHNQDVPTDCTDKTCDCGAVDLDKCNSVEGCTTLPFQFSKAGSQIDAFYRMLGEKGAGVPCEGVMALPQLEAQGKCANHNQLTTRKCPLSGTEEDIFNACCKDDDGTNLCGSDTWKPWCTPYSATNTDSIVEPCTTHLNNGTESAQCQPQSAVGETTEAVNCTPSMFCPNTYTSTHVGLLATSDNSPVTNSETKVSQMQFQQKNQSNTTLPIGCSSYDSTDSNATAFFTPLVTASPQDANALSWADPTMCYASLEDKTSFCTAFNHAMASYYDGDPTEPNGCNGSGGPPNIKNSSNSMCNISKVIGTHNHKGTAKCVAWPAVSCRDKEEKKRHQFDDPGYCTVDTDCWDDATNLNYRCPQSPIYHPQNGPFGVLCSTLNQFDDDFEGCQCMSEKTIDCADR